MVTWEVCFDAHVQGRFALIHMYSGEHGRFALIHLQVVNMGGLL